MTTTVLKKKNAKKKPGGNEHASRSTDIQPKTAEQIENDVMSDLERTHYKRIQDLESRCAMLEDEYETDKANAAASKKQWEKSVTEMRHCIRRGPDPQHQLPFVEDWRGVPIGEVLTLTEKETEKLTEAGVATVEDFENLRAGQNKDYPGGLIDLPRVGETTISKWENEIVDWMSKNATSNEETSASD